MSQHNPLPDFECITVESPLDASAVRRRTMSDERKQQMRATVNNLRTESNLLKHEVCELKELVDVVNKQSKMILNLLREQQSSVASVFRLDLKGRLYLERFPLKTADDLQKMEADVNELTEDKLITTVRSLLTPGGLHKRLCTIFSNDFCIAFNMHGVCGKHRLLDYPKFIDVLFKATMSDSYTRKHFMVDLNYSLKLIKRRYLKYMFCKRKAEKEKEMIQQNENEN